MRTFISTAYTNAARNFAALHAKVAIDHQIVLLHNGDGDPVVWMTLSAFLEQNSRFPSADEITAELTA